MPQHRPRLDPLPADHDPSLQPEFAGFLSSLGFGPNSVLTMQRKPKLAHLAKRGWTAGAHSAGDRSPAE